MKRSMCGLIVLAAAAGLGSCGGDPTGDQIEQGQQVVADPSSVFLSAGGSEFVVVQVLDQLGNQLPVDFQPQNVGPGITVERDTTYLQTTIGTHLETAQRFIVTGTTPSATQFDLVSGELSTTIPVKVTPTGTAVTLSNAAPAINEPLTVTLPAGYRFGTAPGVTVGSDVGITTAVAPDSSSVTVLLPPGTTGTVQVDSVQVDYLPGVNLSLPSDQTVTVSSTPLAGTEAASTAPALPVPALDASTVAFDAPDFTTTANRFYRIDVTEAGNYTVELDWDIGGDLDLIRCADAGCSAPDFAGATAAHPEAPTYALTPGTYYLVVNDYGGDAAGTTLTFTITHEAPPAT
jgi:hypothetical protein